MTNAFIQRRSAILLVALAAAMMLGMVVAGPASADLLSPESGGSPNADRIDTLYWVLFGIAMVVFVGVEVALVYSLFKFRARKGAVASQIHGNTRLEIAWTALPAVILVVLAVVTFAMLPGIVDPPASDADGLPSASGGAQYAILDQPDPPDGEGLTIDVNGQQYLWRFTYPNGAYSYEEMVVPVNTTVLLNVRAQDVIHSWWIPKLGGKLDATPGYNNQTWFKAPNTGIFKGQCAEFCGSGHANMLATVRVVEVAEYQAWVERQAQLIGEANEAAAAYRARLDQEGEEPGATTEDTDTPQDTGGAGTETTP